MILFLAMTLKHSILFYLENNTQFTIFFFSNYFWKYHIHFFRLNTFIPILSIFVTFILMLNQLNPLVLVRCSRIIEQFTTLSSHVFYYINFI